MLDLMPLRSLVVDSRIADMRALGLVEQIKRARRTRSLGARHPDPDSFRSLVAEGVVEVGSYTYGEPRVCVWRYRGSVGTRVTIGKYCSIAPGVTILTGGNHRSDTVSTFPFRIMMDLPGKDDDGFRYSNGDVVIGNDVWVGQDATIMSGVTVGHGAVIATGALVSRPVAPFAIVGGNPAEVIRYRFDERQIAALLEIRWWDWPDAKVREAVPLLNGGTIDEFIARYGSGQ